MAAVPLAAAAAVAGAAYLNARLSLKHDVLFLRVFGSMTLAVSRAARAGRLNFFYELEQRAHDAATASRPFLYFEGASCSYAQAYDAVLRLGHWLRTTHGVRPGDVVALDAPNSHVFVLLWFALWSVGATPAFINYHLTGAALAHSLRVSTARLALVDPAVAGQLDPATLPGMRFVVLTPDVLIKAWAAGPVRAPDAARAVDGPTAMAILIYTSGTTGLPKPAVVSWAKVYTAAMISSKGAGLRPDDVLYLCMPLYHSSASCIGVCGALFAGATAAIGRRFSTKSFWRDVRACDATAFLYVGETCRYLTVAPPDLDPVTGKNLDRKHRVRVAMGNGLRLDVWDKFKERFGIDVRIYPLLPPPLLRRESKN